jgi:hypothetical protein
LGIEENLFLFIGHYCNKNKDKGAFCNGLKRYAMESSSCCLFGQMYNGLNGNSRTGNKNLGLER